MPGMIWSVVRRRAALAAVLAASTLGGCGGSDSTASPCGPTEREPLDPAYLVHVVDEEGVEYLADPPTSGPHQQGPRVSGVVDQPIARPVQVGILERGDVLLQHDPSLSGPPLAQLEALAGGGVVVAPNPDLAATVVATAWLFKRSCAAVDATALRDFVESHRGRGPEG